ncbi:hypothetical protein AB0M47_39420 [Hamadaea sp. NPDC051192]|uniref:hypothetical protein n=1 Tax=Hamadaea sp. NPDC051192 TaxID=3154940 RepID=UPI003442B712
MSKIEKFAAIRRDLAAAMSGRAIEEKHRVGRRMVSAAMASALPPPRKEMPPRGSKLDPFKPVIDEILRADLDAPRKQRHTVRRIYHRLLDEHGMANVSYQVVRTYVADRKPKIRAEAGRGPVTVFFPQTHRPGAHIGRLRAASAATGSILSVASSGEEQWVAAADQRRIRITDGLLAGAVLDVRQRRQLQGAQ